jgi:hypothetical protein
MDPCEASKLASETAVWIWIVRQGEGQWCPGTVQSLAAPNGVATVTVRFECHSLQRSNSRTASFMGISTTQTRFLEPRNLKRIGSDRPQYVPPPLPTRPESPVPEQDL